MKFKRTAALLASAAIMATGGPASAIPPWVVNVGAQTTGHVTFTAHATSWVNFVVAGPSGPVSLSCGAAAATGNLYPGSYPTGQAIAKIDGTVWSGCVGAGWTFNIYQTPGYPWNLNVTGFSGPVWNGHINGISARVNSTTPGLCEYNLTGRMNLTFDTTQVSGSSTFTQTLNISQGNSIPNLTISGVTGCFGLIANGNATSINAAYQIHNPVGLVGIS